jgi:hypothetical protein
MTTEIILSDSALSIEQVVKQRELIKSAMKNAMDEGVHYGKIPGCGDKPSLMQSGAQLLCFLFKVRPEYEITEVDFPEDHREYRILCRLFHTGTEVGQGVGICSTREAKYRYRNEAKEVTWLDEPVPPVYWNLRKKPNDLKRWMETVFQGRDVSIIGTKKNEGGVWFFVEYHGGDGKIENPNIADVFNTVLKIAKKRAFVDATITVTASNDLFTQDLEDIADNLKVVDIVSKETIAESEKEKEKSPGEGMASEAPKSETKPATKPKKSAEGIQGWRGIRVHFGTEGGKVRNRELGTLAISTMEWLESTMGKKNNPSEQDKMLIAGIALWRKEQAGIPQSNISASLELLHAKCEAMKIDLVSIVAVNKDLGGTGETFNAIPEDQAKYLLENWDKTLQAAKDKIDNIPM